MKPRLLVDYQETLETLDPMTCDIVPVVGSVKAIATLAEHYTIILVSMNRPYKDMRTFLTTYFPDIDPINYEFTAAKYTVQGYAMVDDTYYHLVETSCTVKILFSELDCASYYNKDNGIVPIDNWEAITQYLLERVP